MSDLALQIIIVPHRPVHTHEEIDQDLRPALEILFSAPGQLARWRGRKHEERHTLVFFLLWTDLAASHAFFTGEAYGRFHEAIQPALNGRSIQWQNHALVADGEGALSSRRRLEAVLGSPALEVALTKVVEGGVAGYYQRFGAVVTKILDAEPGCCGYFIAPQIENPQQQVLLIDWKSVDAHHEEFERRPGFRACIDALRAYYAEFVVPWHAVSLRGAASMMVG